MKKIVSIGIALALCLAFICITASAADKSNGAGAGLYYEPFLAPTAIEMKGVDALAKRIYSGVAPLYNDGGDYDYDSTIGYRYDDGNVITGKPPQGSSSYIGTQNIYMQYNGRDAYIDYYFTPSVANDYLRFWYSGDYVYSNRAHYAPIINCIPYYNYDEGTVGAIYPYLDRYVTFRGKVWNTETYSYDDLEFSYQRHFAYDPTYTTPSGVQSLFPHVEEMESVYIKRTEDGEETYLMRDVDLYLSCPEYDSFTSTIGYPVVYSVWMPCALRVLADEERISVSEYVARYYTTVAFEGGEFSDVVVDSVQPIMDFGIGNITIGTILGCIIAVFFLFFVVKVFLGG